MVSLVGVPDITTKQYAVKPKKIRTLETEALEILDSLGIPLEGVTPRRLELMALAFIAVADVKAPGGWANAKDLDDGRSISTRDIIKWWNANMVENVSPGSYDDVRRAHLLLPVEAGIVVRSQPGAARNSPTRGYALDPEFAEAVRAYGTLDFDSAVKKILKGRKTYAEILAAKRDLERVPIKIADGTVLSFGPGGHNELIRDIIEEFLPRFGHGTEVLYVGDAEDKFLHYEKSKLEELGFFTLDHGELPDVVAYSE